MGSRFFFDDFIDFFFCCMSRAFLLHFFLSAFPQAPEFLDRTFPARALAPFARWLALQCPPLSLGQALIGPFHLVILIRRGRAPAQLVPAARIQEVNPWRVGATRRLLFRFTTQVHGRRDRSGDGRLFPVCI